MSTRTLFFLCLTTVFVTEYAVAFFECEPDCDGPNEIYTCGSACQTECATLRQPCTIINVRCNDGCYCKDGFARDVNGRCIPIKQCPVHEHSLKRKLNHKNKGDHKEEPDLEYITPIRCTYPNEEYACGSPCQTECATLGKPCPYVNIRCNDGCYCKKDYARNFFGKCIPIAECPKLIEANAFVQIPQEEFKC